MNRRRESAERARNQVRRITRRVTAAGATALLLLGLAAAPAAADRACDRSLGVSCGKVSLSRFSAGPVYVSDGRRTGDWLTPGEGSRSPGYVRDVALVLVPGGFFAHVLVSGRWLYWGPGYHTVHNSVSTYQVRTFVKR